MPSLCSTSAVLKNSLGIIAPALWLQTLRGHEDAVWSLAVDWQSMLLASGSDDKTVKLWSLRRGTCLQTIRGHEYAVRALAVDWQRKLLASGSGNRTVKVWGSVAVRPGEIYELPGFACPQGDFLTSARQCGEALGLPAGAGPEEVNEAERPLGCYVEEGAGLRFNTGGSADVGHWRSSPACAFCGAPGVEEPHSSQNRPPLS